ncbi:Bug family tripartite tricarboxylate transporter substrate binding protein [Caldovatus aquaticus]|uniref:Tripartite tricarboxylate transporter substrate binding protein n=1 Tax=Caldovatus aquaticus TaxID=2865671 RepID=A0ABS7F4B6_9PROT|nr:tripartite tricarboxylate transporter substrate binding protein [Caldovatus aquaticus]MBW8270419.1 tripartite tricarboxylate transporter substrate binding protein [Caldovatus aquaticus]
MPIRQPALTRRALAALAGASLAAKEERAQASDYPNRAVAVIVPFTPGGAADTAGRVVAKGLGDRLGQSFVVENRPGAGSTLGAAMVARAAPDGYTLLAHSTGAVLIAPHFLPVPYDTFRSFTPIAMTCQSNSVVAAHPSVPFRDIPGLIAYARANPGKLRFGSAGNGTITHLFGEIFRMEAGIEIEHVPYRGSSPALVDLLAGRVELIFDTIATEPVRNGQLVGLAVVGERRSPQLPQVPTLGELGFNRAGAVSWFGLAGPAGLPEEVVAKLARETEAICAAPETAEQMARIGLAPRFEAGEALRARWRREYEVFGAVIRRAGVRPG